MKEARENTSLIKKRENQQISIPQLINSEVNLLILPFFALSTKGLKKKLETEYRTIVERGDEKIEILWSVSANPKYGYPGPFDKQIHRAIEQIITEILREKGRVKNPIPLGSLYSLCKRRGIKAFGGSQYNKIKKALQRIIFTGIESKGTFYSKENKKWIEDNFHLYERVIFKGEQLPNGDIADTNYLFLNSWYLQSLNSFYIKPIDFKYLQSLRCKIASRLYEVLGVKFYGLRNKKQNFICYKYSTLSQLLPVTQQRYFSLAKQQLTPAHKELKKTGFLARYKWNKNSGKDWLIYYWPGEKAKKEMRKTEFFESLPEEDFLPEPDEKSEKLSKSKLDLVKKLASLNVSEKVARDLVANNDQQIIKKWIKAVDYARPKDKGAFLVKAIKEEWQVPEGFLRKEEQERKREKQEKARRVRSKKEKEEQRRKKEEIERVDKIYNSLTPSRKKQVKKEAVEKLPAFWKEQLKNREGGRLPKLTQAALEEKKREVIREWIREGKIKKNL